MLKVLLNGANGRMGVAIQALAKEFNAQIMYPVGSGDAFPGPEVSLDGIIDFSSSAGTAQALEFARELKKPILIGTTALTLDVRSWIEDAASEIPVMMTSNYSIGVNVLYHLTEQAAKLLDPSYEAEIFEFHHNKKKDAPSGTALELAELISAARKPSTRDFHCGRFGPSAQRRAGEIGINAARGGDVSGEHTVFFAGQGERIELVHRAQDRQALARGAWMAFRWLLKQEPGKYTMRDVLGLR